MTQAYSSLLPKVTALSLLLALAGCEPGAPAPQEPPEPGVLEATRQGPADAPDGTCWGKTVSPARIETVTEQVQVEPARISASGNVTALPVYRTETRQQIVTPRRDNWFETPCPEQIDTEFTATLQRALAARGLYNGSINGEMDARTRGAVRRYQRSEGGPDSEVLSLETARRLGLVAVPRAGDT